MQLALPATRSGWIPDHIRPLGKNARRIYGVLWFALFLTRPKTVQVSEWYYGLRNSYYRWKRRRAARKFEVYMRQHNREVIFDEHGNYIPPDDNDKKNGGSKSGWVN